MNDSNRTYYAYTHATHAGGVFYVGASGNAKRPHDFSNRKKSHKAFVGLYGRENIIVTIYPFDCAVDAFLAEEEIILACRAAGATLLNISSGGASGGAGVVQSPERRKKIADAQRGNLGHWYGRTGEDSPNFGRRASAEERAKMSVSRIGKKPWNYGGTFSDESRAKMSAAHMGKTHSDETRAKMSESAKMGWAARRAKGGAA